MELKTNKKFKPPIDQIGELLTQEGIPHETRKLYDGYQVGVPCFHREPMCDVIIHRASYGSPQGLLEFWAPTSGQDAFGSLTPEQALEKIKDWFDLNKAGLERQGLI